MPGDLVARRRRGPEEEGTLILSAFLVLLRGWKYGQNPEAR